MEDRIASPGSALPRSRQSLPGRAVALIPAYNPTAALCALVDDLTAAGFDAVVVDDGSHPQAEGVFRAVETTATVLHHRANRGKGEALRTGLDWISHSYPSETVVVTVDADGQHLVNDVVRVCLEQFDQTGDPADRIVLGVRVDSPDTPPRSRVGHEISRFVFCLVTGQAVVDTQTGLRAFRASMIPDLVRIPGHRFDYEMNQLLTLARQGVQVTQVGITTVYASDHVSHYRGLRDSLLIGRSLMMCAVKPRLRRRARR